MSEATQNTLLITNRKALTVNLDPLVYGTFAEIGGEARKPLAIFSRPVGAAGTIAKTISAYDMTSQKARATSACRIAIITQAKIS